MADALDALLLRSATRLAPHASRVCDHSPCGNPPRRTASELRLRLDGASRARGALEAALRTLEKQGRQDDADAGARCSPIYRCRRRSTGLASASSSSTSAVLLVIERKLPQACVHPSPPHLCLQLRRASRRRSSAASCCCPRRPARARQCTAGAWRPLQRPASPARSGTVCWALLAHGCPC